MSVRTIVPAKTRMTAVSRGSLKKSAVKRIVYGVDLNATAVELAEMAGVSPRTVHAWVSKARDRGIMPRVKQGGVS